MKFACALVMLALAVGVQSSGILPALSWGPGAVAWGNGGAWGPSAWGPAAWGHDGSWGPSAWGHDGAWGPAASWGAWGHGGYPGISLSQGPAGHVVAPIAVGHGHEGVYVAKTRGAIHKAPLAGHINSATSINVAPAPGTL